MSELSVGSEGSAPISKWQPQHKYVLDNSLNPKLAEALRLAGWNVLSVNELFGVQPTESIPDEDIIPRCAAEGRSWITADESARRQHELALKEKLVSVLWVKRPKSGMSTAYQFAVVVTALRRFDIELSRNPGHAIHCGVGSTLAASLERLWEKRRPPS